MHIQILYGKNEWKGKYSHSLINWSCNTGKRKLTCLKQCIKQCTVLIPLSWRGFSSIGGSLECIPNRTALSYQKVKKIQSALEFRRRGDHIETFKIQRVMTENMLKWLHYWKSLKKEGRASRQERSESVKTDVWRTVFSQRGNSLLQRIVVVRL